MANKSRITANLVSNTGISTFTDLNITRVNITGVGTISNGSITNLTGTSSTITTLRSTTLNANVGNIVTGVVTNFTSTNGSITNLTGTSSTITTLRSTTLNADTGNIVTGVTTNFTSTNGSITNLTGTAGTVTTLRSTTGNFTTGNIVTGVTTNFTSTNVVISGVTTVSAGTAAAPSISPSGDSNTGIFFISANTASVSTNGIERLRINSDGNVGIGTSVDASNIQSGRFVVFDSMSKQPSSAGWGIVVQDTNTDGALGRGGAIAFGARRSDGGTFNAGAISGAKSNSTGANENGDLVFHSSVSSTLTERMRIMTDGGVAIGDTTTSRRFKTRFESNTVYSSASMETTSAQVYIHNPDTTTGAYTGIHLGVANNSDAIIAGVRTGNDDIAITFGTRSTVSSGAVVERMRIAPKGNTTIFAASAVCPLQLATADGAGTTNELLQGYHTATSTTSLGTNVIRIYTNGNIQNTNNNYNVLSDVKLKENIVDANSQWSDIKNVRIRNFNFKPETGYETHRQIGVVAQELEQISPGLVYETPDRDSEGNDLGTVTKGVQTSVLYIKSIKALQEAMERIEQLETSNTDLLARVATLESV